MQRFNSVWEALEIPEPTDQEKITFWMKQLKEANARLATLERAAEQVTDAYRQRFEIIAGSLYGPIDAEIVSLSKAIGSSSRE